MLIMTADSFLDSTTMPEDTLRVTTPVCLVCGKAGSVRVRRNEYERWVGGELIQRAFPAMPIQAREMLCSGTHPECWDQLFGDDEA